MKYLLDKAFRRQLRHGALAITWASGETSRYGDGTGEPVHLVFADGGAERRLAFDPELAMGELYMDERLRFAEGSVYDFLTLIYSNVRKPHPSSVSTLLDRARAGLRAFARNTPDRARGNVAHHYDLDQRLYRLFLDPDLQYSCAYFETPDDSLADAQLAKKRHLAAKLRLRPGSRVLDIGSGWGGLGLYLAETADADVTGVTLSEEQHRVSNMRAGQSATSERARFLLQDYRTLGEKFDRIVSVGMFEHVGLSHFQEYFDACARLLSDDGVMVLHAIGRVHGPDATNPWFAKYIFPGGYIPALSEVLPAIERADLIVTDIEILRLHYAETLRAWRERFLARRADAAALYDERFCRMWEFYLAGSEVAFRDATYTVFQIQIVKDQNVLPLTRAYMAEAEEELRQAEDAHAPLRLAGEREQKRLARRRECS